MSENVFVVRHGPTGAGLLKEKGMIFVKFPKDCKCYCIKGEHTLETLFTDESTCTALKEDLEKVLTAITTMGGWTFSIPEYAKWTIVIQDTKQQANAHGKPRISTRILEITEEDSVKMVAIGFELFLYDKGLDYTIDTVGEWNTSGGTPTYTEEGEMYTRWTENTGYGAARGLYLVYPINIIGYEKLCFNISRWSGAQAGIGMRSYWALSSARLASYYYPEQSAEKYAALTGTGKYEIDLTDLRGEEYYITFGTRAADSTVEVGITQCWLE